MRTAVSLSVIFNGRRHEITCPPTMTLLDCVLDHPDIAQVPYSCLDGECGACMAILRQGEVYMQANRVLSQKEQRKGYILTCQSLPRSDAILIDYDA